MTPEELRKRLNQLLADAEFAEMDTVALSDFLTSSALAATGLRCHDLEVACDELAEAETYVYEDEDESPEP